MSLVYLLYVYFLNDHSLETTCTRVVTLLLPLHTALCVAPLMSHRCSANLANYFRNLLLSLPRITISATLYLKSIILRNAVASPLIILRHLAANSAMCALYLCPTCKKPVICYRRRCLELATLTLFSMLINNLSYECLLDRRLYTVGSHISCDW